MTDTTDFADEPTQNVTIVHGSNGSGKTTPPNAFTWVLYDDSELRQIVHHWWNRT
jgi:DNA sulfur modification protein DndD